MDDLVTIEVPLDKEGDTAVILISEIAALREHTVVSYTYMKWTKIILKNDVIFDARLTLSEVKSKIDKAMELAR